MQRNTRFGVAALAAAFLGTSLMAPVVANASEDGKKNTMLGLGAGAAALLLTQKNKLPGLLVAGGAAYAGTQWQRDINNRHKREREAAYRRNIERRRQAARYHRSKRTSSHSKYHSSRYRRND